MYRHAGGVQGRVTTSPSSGSQLGLGSRRASAHQSYRAFTNGFALLFIIGSNLMHVFTRTATQWRRAFLPAAFLLAFLIGCGKTTAPDYQSAVGVAGTWQWVQSLDVTTWEVSTPSSAGFTATLTLVAESASSGTFTYLRSGAPPVTGHYQISFEDEDGNDFITVEPGFDFLTRNAWIAVSPDSLRLNGGFELGYNSKYARVSDQAA